MRACGSKSWLTRLLFPRVESAKVIRREVRKKHHSTWFGKCVPTDCTAFDWMSFGTKPTKMMTWWEANPLGTLSRPSTRPKFIRVWHSFSHATRRCCQSSSHSVYPYVVTSSLRPPFPFFSIPCQVLCQINVHLRTMFG